MLPFYFNILYLFKIKYTTYFDKWWRRELRGLKAPPPHRLPSGQYFYLKVSSYNSMHMIFGCPMIIALPHPK